MGLAGRDLSFDCDWKRAVGSRPGTGMFGYLLAYNMAGIRMGQDIQVPNPYNQSGPTVISGPTITCCGVIDQFLFEGADDPIRIRCYISRANAASIRTAASGPMKNTKIEFRPYIINYDGEKRAWYEAVWTQNHETAPANLDTTGGGQRSGRTRGAEESYLSFVKFEFQAIPANGKQTTFHFADDPSTRFVELWGDV